MQWYPTHNRLRLISLCCTITAVGTGLTYFHMGGAPLRYSVINLITLAAGSSLLWVAAPGKRVRYLHEGFILFTGALLIAAALWGVRVHGVNRWLAIAHFNFEPGLMFLPPAVLLFARKPNAWSAAGITLLALATALQPDRSMAGALCLGLAAMLIIKRDRWNVLALCTACAAFGITLVRPDRVPPVPFVEQVFASTFALHPLLGMTTVLAAALLLVPAIAGLCSGGKERQVHLAFLGIWLGLFLASAMGNYPTPMVGYGCSGIIGYFLSIRCLPKTDKQ